MLSNSNRELINSLKGRVSKVLNVKSTLRLEERSEVLRVSTHRELS